MLKFNQCTDKHLLASLKKELEYKNLPKPLKMVFKAHGFSLRQEIGILLLFKIYQVEIPSHFHNPEAHIHEEISKANDWLIATTQKFLRKGERWSKENQIHEKKLSEFKDSLLKAGALLGFADEQIPNFKSLGPQLVIIPGGLEARIELRCRAVIQDIQNGNVPEAVILLTGDRELQDFEAPELAERTEASMMQKIWQQALNEVGMCLPMYLVCAPKKIGQTRANTQDTVEALAKLNSFIKDIVVYIEQPFVPRFLSIFGEILRTQGRKLHLRPIDNDLTSQLASIGDEIGRLLYFQNSYFESVFGKNWVKPFKRPSSFDKVYLLDFWALSFETL